MAQARLLGLPALGITDRNILAGIARAHQRAEEAGIRLVVGCRLDLRDSLPVLVYPTHRAAYARLCRLLSIGKGRAGKGACDLGWQDLAAHGEGLVAILLPDAPGAALAESLARLRADFRDRGYLALTLRRRPGDAGRLRVLADMAQAACIPTVATGDVLYHSPARRILQDVVTCIREGCTIDQAGFRRERTVDRCLKSSEEMARLFARHPEAVARTLEIVGRCRFSLADLRYQYPEEVIQWIYERYGRDRAAICATVIRYRARGAVREVGKVMGLTEDVTSALASQLWGWSEDGVTEERAEELNLNLQDRRLRLTLELARELIGFPRHLSQHPGGFVLTRDRLDELVPIEPAAMVDRQVIEWDKDDIDNLRWMKVDVLGLGMLGCMRRAFDLLKEHHGERLDLASVPTEDPATYAMIRKADTVGVFQIESRAQMAMLPRLKPRTFYDLVIEVAIIRPGPIQGDMVHPYLRRREGKEKPNFPTPELERVLGKTLGVPLFQEQAMQVAIVCAGFTPSEADQLRRSMATFKVTGGIAHFKGKLISGMIERHYTREFAEQTVSQIEGFGSYGFPESHAASFALIVYASSWMKCHHPDVFCCALLNAQPLGFYAPAQIVRDAQAHGVEIRPVCVNTSRWDCTLEPGDGRFLAVRLGMRMVKGLSNAHAAEAIAARGDRTFGSVDGFCQGSRQNRRNEQYAK